MRGARAGYTLRPRPAQGELPPGSQGCARRQERRLRGGAAVGDAGRWGGGAGGRGGGRRVRPLSRPIFTTRGGSCQCRGGRGRGEASDVAQSTGAVCTMACNGDLRAYILGRSGRRPHIARYRRQGGDPSPARTARGMLFWQSVRPAAPAKAGRNGRRFGPPCRAMRALWSCRTLKRRHASLGRAPLACPRDASSIRGAAPPPQRPAGGSCQAASG